MKQFEYRLPKWVGIVFLPMSGILTQYAYKKAITHSELHYKGMHLAAEHAQYAWWVMFVFMLAMAILGLWILFQSFGKPRIVQLYEDKIIAPKAPILNTINTIYYRDITKLQLKKVGKNRQFIITDLNNKIMILDLHFQDKSDFEEIVRFVQMKKAAQ
ncbi:hypothetical protein ACKLNO_07115 [Neisseriaceae bacterium B1]